ncbi:hypothetical protein A0O21_04240 [Streptococcus pantholopis]|uniref:Phosphoglycerate mutase n=1 Tax=Streptococcus pantholopis TaxID=1811193 RepID=A0A172Q774_9STRE|nr:hypothetical protein A0O21_04240 [Streptococcus pantholopis]
MLFVSHGSVITQFYRHMTENPPVPAKRMANCAILKISCNDDCKMEVQSIFNPMEEEYIYER